MSREWYIFAEAVQTQNLLGGTDKKPRNLSENGKYLSKLQLDDYCAQVQWVSATQTRTVVMYCVYVN
jgi:hypothetical protein